MLGSTTIPLRFTVFDAALNLVGISPAAIYIPYYAGLEAEVGFQFGAGVTTEASADLQVSLASDGTATGQFEFTSPDATAALLPGGLVDSQPTTAAAADAFFYFQAKPSVRLLKNLAFAGIDLRLGPALGGTLEPAPELEPPYCLQVNPKLRARVNGYLKAIGGIDKETTAVSYEYEPPGQLLTLGNCKLLTRTLITVPTEGPTLFEPLSIQVVVEPYHADKAGDRVPAGRVSVELVGGERCVATLDPTGTGSCSITAGSPAGDRAISAQFEGDSNFAGSTAIVPIQLAKADTRTDVTPVPGTAAVGDVVTFNVAVSAVPDRGVIPPGTVEIRDSSGTGLCSAQLDVVTGRGSCVATIGTTGDLQVVAYYLGDDLFEVSSESAALGGAADDPYRFVVTSEETRICSGRLVSGEGTSVRTTGATGSVASASDGNYLFTLATQPLAPNQAGELFFFFEQGGEQSPDLNGGFFVYSRLGPLPHVVTINSVFGGVIGPYGEEDTKTYVGQLTLSEDGIFGGVLLTEVFKGPCDEEGCLQDGKCVSQYAVTSASRPE
jgi:hypothetical protein